MAIRGTCRGRGGGDADASRGAGLFVERRFGSATPASVRFSVVGSTTGLFSATDAPAQLVRGIGRVEGCIFAWKPVGWLSVAPCLGVEGGPLLGQGQTSLRIQQAGSGVGVWWGVEAVFHVVAQFGSVIVGVQGGPVVSLPPLWAFKYHYQKGTTKTVDTVDQAWPVTAVTAIVLGASLSVINRAEAGDNCSRDPR